MTVLEGEGMFNDATALVLYQLAVAAAVTGERVARVGRLWTSCSPWWWAWPSASPSAG